MSKTTLALEAAVAAVIAIRKREDGRLSARERLELDKAFMRVLKLIAPRIRHFIRQYGLVSWREDAEQACAIAVHRAIEAYRPDQAQFTTFVNWQIRGELQSLRFRLMTDQRASAKKVGASTVSLNVTTQGADGEEITLEALLEDENALALTESGASDYLAAAATRSLIDSYVEQLRGAAIEKLRRRPRPKRAAATADATMPRLRSPTFGIDPAELEQLEQKLLRNREIIERRLFEIARCGMPEGDVGVTNERARQITKRAAKTIGELAGRDPRFAMMAEYCQIAKVRADPSRASADWEPAMLRYSQAITQPAARRVA